jgi:hypothetical protein
VNDYDQQDDDLTPTILPPAPRIEARFDAGENASPAAQKKRTSTGEWITSKLSEALSIVSSGRSGGSSSSPLLRHCSSLSRLSTSPVRGPKSMATDFEDEETPRPPKPQLTPAERRARVQAAEIVLQEHAELIRLREEVEELRAKAAENAQLRKEVRQRDNENSRLRTDLVRLERANELLRKSKSTR